MKNQDFTTSFTVDQTPDEAFEAIKNVRGWWSEGVVGGTSEIGDVFTYRHGDIHYSRQELSEMVPGKRLVWDVLDDAYLKFTRDSNEWKGTHLSFDISRVGDKTEVRFTHAGLVREHECFDACSKGWTFYVGDSLRRLISSGKGQPDPKEKAALPKV